MNRELNKVQSLLYNLIFENDTEYEIKLLDYIDELYLLDDFTSKILSNLLDSGIKIKEQIYVLTKEKKTWILKIKR
jgi:hypothetical protein